LRLFACSDLHIDYPENFKWINNLSISEFQQDVIIIAGDVSNNIKIFKSAMELIAKRFKKVMFVPGNHELWVKGTEYIDSLVKLHEIQRILYDLGCNMSLYHSTELIVCPIFGWYDYSFATVSEELREVWSDYYYCKWPLYIANTQDICSYFYGINPIQAPDIPNGKTVVTFSHFLPRIDLMPNYIPQKHKIKTPKTVSAVYKSHITEISEQYCWKLDPMRLIYPVLGSARIDEIARRYHPQFHVYGHSHVNAECIIDGVHYINAALGYPSETNISYRELRQII